MASIPAKLENLFTFASTDDPMVWCGEYRPGSLQPDEDIPTALDHLPSWKFQDYEVDEMPLSVWGNDQLLALLLVDCEGGSVELPTVAQPRGLRGLQAQSSPKPRLALTAGL